MSQDRFRSDEDQQWLVERGLQLACEIALDSGNHVLAGAFGQPAETYPDVVTGLVRVAVLDPQLAADLAGLGGFRNLLVHGYLDLDPDRVWAVLETAPERFEAFAGAILRWLDRQA
jgi:uncharacterized protein YutE (UPF0331/DUF86 family)